MGKKDLRTFRVFMLDLYKFTHVIKFSYEIFLYICDCGYTFCALYY